MVLKTVCLCEKYNSVNIFEFQAVLEANCKADMCNTAFVLSVASQTS